MKYIKKFEKIDKINQYEDGDYILLDIDEIRKNNDITSSHYEPIDNMAYIYHSGEQMYAIEFYNGKDLEFNYIEENEIIRELTPEEIEEFKLKKATHKYGL